MTHIKTFLVFLILITTALPTIAKRPSQEGPTSVIVAPVKKIMLADRVEALGTTKSNEMALITANTAEKVTAIHFQEGQVAKTGDLLVTLRLDKRAILAPFDGILGLREVSVGTLVQPGDTITTIDDISIIKIDFDVPSIFLSLLHKDMPITGKVAAFGHREFSGKIKTINTRIDPITRMIKIRAIAPNKDRILKPGLLMKIDIMTHERQALIIPEEALIKRGEKNFVYIATKIDGQLSAQETEIEIGSRIPGEIEVLSGLKRHDQVITHGLLKIRDGIEISIRAIETEDIPLAELLIQNGPLKNIHEVD